MAMPAPNWRDAEAAIFTTAAAMLHGRLPAVRPGDAVEARRLGYLAEAVARYLDGAHGEDLLAFARTLRTRAEAAAGPIDRMDYVPLVPGERPGGGHHGLDDLGDGWRIAPGFDVGRFIAEGYAAPPQSPY